MDTPDTESCDGAVPASPVVEARLALDQDERLESYRLRYDVYVREQNKPYPDADHAQRTLCDALDACADIVVVRAGRRIVATLRANYLEHDVVHARYADELALDRLGSLDRREVCVCSRLAASPDCRDSTARRAAFAFIYEHGFRRGARLCFATCAPGLLPLFIRYGFREYAPPFRDAVAGPLHRTLLVMDDIARLRRIHSPFVAQASQFALTQSSRSVVESAIHQYEVNHARR